MELTFGEQFTELGKGIVPFEKIYDWDAYYQTIRELQPEAVISVCGPVVRWCGNEAGHCRKSEWSVVPEVLKNVEKIEEKSQKIDDGEFSRRITSTKDAYWRSKDGTESAEIILRFDSAKTFDKVVFMEHIASSGQRIEKFTMEYENEAEWTAVYKGTVVGYKRICCFKKVTSPAIRLKIEQSRFYPTLSRFDVFRGESI